MIDELQKKVENCIRLIPFGRVSTINEVAKVCGSKSHKVLKIIKDLMLEDVAWYRVVEKGGKMLFGLSRKEKRLQKSFLLAEGIEIVSNKANLGKYNFYFW